jgi:hypothetical protein
MAAYGHLKRAFCFFLADYHNVDYSSAWPSLQTLAEDTSTFRHPAKALLKEMLEANT